MISRNNIIDALKGVAILLMVFGHLIQFTSVDNSYLYNPIYIFIYSFHMPLFIMISGFFFNKSLNKKSVKNLLNDRLVTILLPYVSWTIIFITVWAVFNHFNLSFFQLCQKYIYTFLYVSKLWFLWVLFVCILLVCLNLLIKRYIGGISILFIVLFIYVLPETQMLSLINVKYMFPFFILGYYYHEYSNVFKEWIRYSSYVSIIIYPVLLFFWSEENFSFIIDSKNLNPIIYKYITAFSGILAIVFVFRNFYKHFEINYLQKLGRNSIAIYIISDYLIALPSHFKFIFFNNSIVLNSVILLFFSLVIAEICLLIEKLLEKNKFISFTLFGKKS